MIVDVLVRNASAVYAAEGSVGAAPYSTRTPMSRTGRSSGKRSSTASAACSTTAASTVGAGNVVIRVRVKNV